MVCMRDYLNPRIPSENLTGQYAYKLTVNTARATSNIILSQKTTTAIIRIIS